MCWGVCLGRPWGLGGGEDLGLLQQRDWFELAALALLAFGSAVMAFWTPYADWIYVVVSSTAMLMIIVLVLRPKP